MIDRVFQGPDKPSPPVLRGKGTQKVCLYVVDTQYKYGLLGTRLYKAVKITSLDVKSEFSDKDCKHLTDGIVVVTEDHKDRMQLGSANKLSPSFSMTRGKMLPRRIGPHN